MTTYLTGYWHVTNNTKHSFHSHYKKFIPKTLKMLRGCNIVFCYDDDNIVSFIKKHVRTNNIIFKKIPIQSLPSYDLSKYYLKSCKNQNNKGFGVREKGLVHYKREYKRSGEHSYRSIFSIWTSKILILKDVIEENPFNTEYFAWNDVGIAKVNKISRKILTNTYSGNQLSYLKDVSSMKYFGKLLEIPACFLTANKNTWNEIIPLYENELNENKRSNYAHDEETILNLVYKKNRNLFSGIKFKNY